MNETERTQVRQNFRNIKMGQVFDFLEALPRDMLFSLRVGNLTRSIHRDLVGENSPRQRFAINSRYAVKGSYVISYNEREIIAHKVLEERHKHGRVEKPVYGGLSFRRPRTLIEDIPDVWPRILFIKDFAILSINLWLIDQFGWFYRWYKSWQH